MNVKPISSVSDSCDRTHALPQSVDDLPLQQGLSSPLPHLSLLSLPSMIISWFHRHSSSLMFDVHVLQLYCQCFPQHCMVKAAALTTLGPRLD